MINGDRPGAGPFHKILLAEGDGAMSGPVLIDQAPTHPAGDVFPLPPVIPEGEEGFCPFTMPARVGLINALYVTPVPADGALDSALRESFGKRALWVDSVGRCNIDACSHEPCVSQRRRGASR